MGVKTQPNLADELLRGQHSKISLTLQHSLNMQMICSYPKNEIHQQANQPYRDNEDRKDRHFFPWPPHSALLCN